MTPEPPTRDSTRAPIPQGRPSGTNPSPPAVSLEEALRADGPTLGALFARLRCPVCEARMAKQGAGVRCANGHVVPVVEGYLDASSALAGGGPAASDATASDATASDATASDATAKTFASFGYEWTTFSESREEDEHYAEHYLRDLDTGRLAGLVGLDAGCGRARYTRFLAPHLSAVVGLDGSDAVIERGAQPQRDAQCGGGALGPPTGAVRRRQFRVHRLVRRVAPPRGSSGGLRHLAANARARRGALLVSL